MARVYDLWIEEPDKNVFHGVARREGPATFVAGCGWELRPRQGGRVWPRKGDGGPPEANRCHACLATED
jgi:hypothetical protein